MMRYNSLYLKLIRFDKPIGSYLLMWPCLWGLKAGANHMEISWASNFVMRYILLLSIGAFLMRSLGCIINDYVDRDIDKKVQRTQERPLASQALSLRQAIWLSLVLSAGGFVVFMLLPVEAKVWAILGGVLMVIYPFMKRFTMYPQVILGIAFSTGVLVGYVTLTQICTLSALFLMGSYMAFVVAFDTIYAFQDIEDDEKLLLKSTALLYKMSPKKGVGGWYFLGSLCVFCYYGVIYSFDFYMIITQPLMMGYIIWSGVVLYFWNPLCKESCALWFKRHGIAGALGLLV